MYDYAIVGAGINGSFMAHFLQKAGKKVLLLDKEGIASGGSGAAGAFLAPKIGKGGPLQLFINKAYNFSIEYYITHFSHLLTQKGLLHIPKDAEDHFSYSKTDTQTPSDPLPESVLSVVKDSDLASKGIYYASSALIEPDTLCTELAKGAQFLQEEIVSMKYQNNYWLLNETIQAKHVILASGADNFPMHERYLKFRPVWGERIEAVSSTPIPCNFHQKISVSATKSNGRIVIGATHEQNVLKKPLQESAAIKLMDQAKALLDLDDLTLVDHRGGVRSGSFDYFPVVGPLVDVEKTLQAFPDLIKGAKINPDTFIYYPKLSIINGVGGRGFVLAPYLAFELSGYLLKNQEITTAILPSRLFTRWAKKDMTLRRKEVK